MKRPYKTGTVGKLNKKNLRKPYYARVTIGTVIDENGKKR